LRRAKGRYIAYLNHDDLWLPNHLRVLVNCIEETKADFVSSILQILTPHGSWVEAPEYPDAPVPPHATSTLHRQDVVQEIGNWPSPKETVSYPRVAFFRQGQFRNKKFVLAAYLTALMFYGDFGGGYAEPGPQREYLDQIRNNPRFAEERLGKIFVGVFHELGKPATVSRLRRQVIAALMRALVKRHIDPARIRFWKRAGRRVNDWRKFHGLPTE
jgi:hypothetical protein